MSRHLRSPHLSHAGDDDADALRVCVIANTLTAPPAPNTHPTARVATLPLLESQSGRSSTGLDAERESGGGDAKAKGREREFAAIRDLLRGSEAKPRSLHVCGSADPRPKRSHSLRVIAVKTTMEMAQKSKPLRG